MSATEAAGERGRPRVTRKRLVIGSIVTVVVGVGGALLVGKAAGFARLLEELRLADPGWLALCFGAECVSFAGYLLAFHESARFGGGPRMPPWSSARLVAASIGASRVVAAGGAGGLAVIYWALRQAGEATARSVVRVLGFNTLLYGVFGALALLAGALHLARVGGEAPAGMAVGWVVTFVGCAAAALWVISPGRVDRLTSHSPDAGWARRGVALAIAGVDFVRQMLAVRGVRERGLIGSAAWWAGDIACLWAGLHAFDAGVSAPQLVLAYTTGYVATLLPLPTGGVGGVDAAMTFTLTAVGVPLADALLGVVAYRLFAFWIPTVPAVVALATLPRLGRDLRALPGTEIPEKA